MRAFRNELIWFSLVVATLIGALACFSVYGAEPEKAYGCSWIDCHQDGKGSMKCDAPKTGTSEELVEVIKKNESGAVSYNCGPRRKK